MLMHPYGIYISCATYTNLIILTRTDKVEQSQAGEEEGEVCRGGHHQPFIPLVVKTTGVVGLKVQTFFEELGHQLRGTTGEPLARPIPAAENFSRFSRLCAESKSLPIDNIK